MPNDKVVRTLMVGVGSMARHHIYKMLARLMHVCRGEKRCISFVRHPGLRPNWWCGRTWRCGWTAGTRAPEYLYDT